MINVFLTQSSKTLLKNKDSDSALFLEDGKTFLGYARTTLVVQCTGHAFCQFPLRWIYYYDSNESTGKET